MKACSTARFSYCTNFAAAGTSAANIRNLDTVLLAVSILLALIIPVLRT